MGLAKPIPVIVETDIGGDMDDTWALVQMLRCPELDCKLIITTTGDTSYRAKLTAKLLQLAGRTDIPIAIGEASNPPGNFQEPWLDGFSFDEYDGLVLENGVQAACELMEEIDELTFISISPCTASGKIVRRLGDKIARHRFVGMHGAFQCGYGSSKIPVSESNVRHAVPDFLAVMKAPWKDILLTPLDTCGKVQITGEAYRNCLDSKDKLVQAIIENYRIWAKLVTFVDITEDRLQTYSSDLFDTVAVYLAYDESYVKTKSITMACNDDGLTYEDPEGIPIRIAYEWRDLEAFCKELATRLLNEALR